MKHTDREEVTKDSNTTSAIDYGGDDEEDDWGGEVEWTAQDENEEVDEDVNDESAAYLEFLNQEV
jgi:importin-7